MNQYPEFQHDLAQQQQTHQLLYTQSAIAKPEQSVGTASVVTTPSLGQLDTVALVQYGGFTAAIILSIAVLIFVLAEYNKVFIPVMLQKRDEKNQ